MSVFQTMWMLSLFLSAICGWIQKRNLHTTSTHHRLSSTADQLLLVLLSACPQALTLFHLLTILLTLRLVSLILADYYNNLWNNWQEDSIVWLTDRLQIKIQSLLAVLFKGCLSGDQAKRASKDETKVKLLYQSCTSLIVPLSSRPLSHSICHRKS